MGFRKRQVMCAVTNVVCFLVVMVTSLALTVSAVSPLHLGFFCDDDNIRYPYSKDTISVSVLGLTCLLPPILLVVGIEIAYGILAARRHGEARNYTPEGSSSDSAQPWNKRTAGAVFKKGLGRAGILVACLIQGNGLCYILTEVFKISFGRLRPYFLSACQPETDVTSFSNCSGTYIEEITCLNPDKNVVLDIRKSFVSGHASISAFNMLFICLYLQLRLPTTTPRLLVSVLQAVALAYGVFVSGTRIYDHAHHPQDLLGGVALAVLCVWITIFKMCPDFVRHPPRKELNTFPTNQGTVLVQIKE